MPVFNRRPLNDAGGVFGRGNVFVLHGLCGVSSGGRCPRFGSDGTFFDGRRLRVDGKAGYIRAAVSLRGKCALFDFYLIYGCIRATVLPMKDKEWPTLRPNFSGETLATIIRINSEGGHPAVKAYLEGYLGWPAAAADMVFDLLWDVYSPGPPVNPSPCIVPPYIPRHMDLALEHTTDPLADYIVTAEIDLDEEETKPD